MIPKNPEPTFDRPSHHKARPAFLRACHTHLSKVPLSDWDGWHLIQHVHGKSKIYKHAENAMNAIALCVVHFVDLQSGALDPEATVTKIAELTGLMTESKAGNVSISRASRAIQRCVKAGLFEGELVWDKELGCWLPKFLNVTELFWEVAHPEGYKGYEKAREQQFSFRNQGLANPNEWLTVTEAKERRRRAHIKKAFEYRRDKQIKNKERRLAKKLGDKENKLARGQIAKDILDSVDTCHGLTFDSFTSLINQRTALYRKIADDPDPPKH